MKKIFSWKTETWNALVLLDEDKFFEGVVFDGTSDIPSDLISGYYNETFGEYTFAMAKSKDKYVLYPDDPDNIDYVIDGQPRLERNFFVACHDIYENYTTSSLTMTEHKLETEDSKKEIEELELSINECKSRIYGKKPIFRRIK